MLVVLCWLQIFLSRQNILQWSVYVKYSVTIICLSVRHWCYEWGWGCVCGRLKKKKACKIPRWKGSGSKRQTLSIELFQHVPITAALKQSPARRFFWPILRAGGDQRKTSERGKTEGGVLREAHGQNGSERGWNGNNYIQYDRKAENERQRPQTSQKVRTLKHERLQRGKAARYSEPLLEMINQLHWAELTSGGLVCKFSSCPNNPLHTHTHTHQLMLNIPYTPRYSYRTWKSRLIPACCTLSAALQNSPVSVDFSCIYKSKHICSQTVFSQRWKKCSSSLKQNTEYSPDWTTYLLCYIFVDLIFSIF